MNDQLMYAVTATRNSHLEVLTFPIGVFDDKDMAIESARNNKNEFGKHYDYYVYEFTKNLVNTSSPPIFVV